MSESARTHEPSVDSHAGLRWALVGVVNHELRTPLTTLLGHAELLEDLDLPHTAQQSVEAIVRAGTQLSELASMVSEIAELDAVNDELVRHRTDLVMLACGVLAAFTTRAAGVGIALRVVNPAAEVVAMVDPVRVRRALAALVRNAVEHAPSGTSVELEVSADDDTVSLCVTDLGPGIAAEHLDRVRAPFACATYSPEDAHGRGLGLAICNAVAAAHGGELVLGPNQPTGLRASLRLPRERLHLAV